MKKEFESIPESRRDAPHLSQQCFGFCYWQAGKLAIVEAREYIVKGRATDGCIFKCAGLRRECAQRQAIFLTCMGQEKATASLVPAAVFGMETALTHVSL